MWNMFWKIFVFWMLCRILYGIQKKWVFTRFYSSSLSRLTSTQITQKVSLCWRIKNLMLNRSEFRINFNVFRVVLCFKQQFSDILSHNFLNITFHKIWKLSSKYKNICLKYWSAFASNRIFNFVFCWHICVIHITPKNFFHLIFNFMTLLKIGIILKSFSQYFFTSLKRNIIKSDKRFVNKIDFFKSFEFEIFFRSIILLHNSVKIELKANFKRFYIFPINVNNWIITE